MPKGKRTRVVALTRTRKKGLESKKKLIDELRDSIEEYGKIFVFSVRDMRNSKLKDVRARWKTSRFFFGKNKVMAIALGRNAEEEQGEGLHQLAAALKGQCGLMFTNNDKDEVLDYFESHVEPDYARAGNVATETVILDAGPLPDFSHSLEPYLRTKLNLKTSLQRGVITLLKEHVVCKKGQRLNPEQTRLLKLMNHPMAEFRVNMIAVWNKDGSFERFREDEEEEEEEEDGNDGMDSEGEEMESD